MPDSRLAKLLTERLEASFYDRVPEQDGPTRVRTSAVDPNVHSASRKPDKAPQYEHEYDMAELPASPMGDTAGQAGTKQADAEPGANAPAHDRSLLRALHQVFWRRWWVAGALQLIGTMLQTTTPLVTRELLTWLSVSYAWHHLNEEERASLGVRWYAAYISFQLIAMHRQLSRMASAMASDYLLRCFSCNKWGLWYVQPFCHMSS